MPLDKDDVVNVLRDPLIAKIDFWVGKIHIYPGAFEKIIQLIKDEDITINPGVKSNNAYYHSDTDTLDTPSTEPPPDANTKSLLLHECVHALVDMIKIDVTDVTNEIAAYLTQITYWHLNDPHLSLRPSTDAWWGFFYHVASVIKKFKLDEPAGRGTRLTPTDYDFLLTELLTLPGGDASTGNKLYGHLTLATKAMSNGIVIRHNDVDPRMRTSWSAKDDSFIAVPADVLFDTNKDVLKSAALTALNKVGKQVYRALAQAVKGSRAIVNGHTDNVGNAAYNQKLSERRAAAVGKWLKDNNYVHADQLLTQGFGMEQPKVPNTTLSSRGQNRRVEIFVNKF